MGEVLNFTREKKETESPEREWVWKWLGKLAEIEILRREIAELIVENQMLKEKIKNA